MGRSDNPLLQPCAHLSLVALTWWALAVIDWFLIGPTTPAELGYYTLAVAAFLPFSLLLVNFIYHFAYTGETLPRASLDDTSGEDAPRVAILYTTYNDVVRECLAWTEAAVEYPVDYWILSDSDDPAAVETERGFDAWERYIRKTDRGGKCGIINDWLNDHGDDYDYLLTLDADTMLAEGNLTRLVEHAEHPGNDDIGVFQTLKAVHPSLATTTFARTVGRGVKWSTRISPAVMKLVYEQNTYWGSAGLLCIEAITDAGGYDEQLICEDFVLTVNMDRAGWRAVVVDVISYEGFPLDLHALQVRTTRWVRANRQMLPLLFSRGVSVGSRVNVLTPVLFYAVTPILLGMVVLAAAFPQFGTAAVPSVAFAAAVFAFIFLHRGVVASRELGQFLTTAVLETLVVLGMSFRVTTALFTGRSIWVPSRKTARSFTWGKTIRHTLPEITLGVGFFALTVGRSETLEVNLLVWLWAVSYLSAPFILRYTSTERPEEQPDLTPHRPERRKSPSED